MTGQFGKFIETKRKEQNITLRGLAAQLGITPAYMSDIEKGHRYPPDRDKLYALAELLSLSKENTYLMFDLAAGEKENAVSLDLCEYIMSTEKARVALRLARENNITDATWSKIIEMVKAEQ
jgi:transcriptional regulator with XRE-family HTH domain